MLAGRDSVLSEKISLVILRLPENVLGYYSDLMIQFYYLNVSNRHFQCTSPSIIDEIFFKIVPIF